MKKILVVIAFLGCALAAHGGEELGVPVFDRQDCYGEIIAVLPAMPPQSGEGVRGFSVQAPLCRYHTFYPVRLDDGRSGNFSPEVMCRAGADGKPEILLDPVQPPWRLGVAALLGVALIGVVLALLHWRRNGVIRRGSAAEAALLAALCVLTRQLLLLHRLIDWVNTVPAEADGYFTPAIDILNGNWAGPWSYTIGTAVFYWPFMLIGDLKSFYELALPFYSFSGFVLAPGCLVLGFYILKKLGLSNLHAFLPMLLWAIWPFISYHVENWDAPLMFKSYFALPDPVDGWKFYRTMIGAGFNAMSDTPGLFLVLLSLWFALRAPVKNWSVAALGLILAFACMVRINNIFFVPVLAFLVLYRRRGTLTPGRAARLALWATAGFLLGFLPQFWINLRQFGNPLTFGYIRHYPDWAEELRPARGFVWEVFIGGRHVAQLAGANLAAWALGACGLIFMQSRQLRTVLALWSLPMILFFTGYTHTFCDAQRFIIASFPAFFAAFFALELWSELSRRELAALGGCCAAALLLTAPSSWKFPTVQPFGIPFGEPFFALLAVLIGIGFIALAAHFYRRGDQKTMLFSLIFPGLFYSANGWIFVLIFCILLLRAAADTIRLLRPFAPPGEDLQKKSGDATI